MIDFHGDLILNKEGSAQKVIKSFCDNLDIDISCLSVSYNSYKEEIINNVKYYTVPENRLKNKIFNKILNLKLFTYDEMIKIMEKEKFDILHFHNRLELVDKLVNRLSYKPKIVCHFHREFNNPIIPRWFTEC
jgi:Ran GTPase-activating protein (RanGAP) involved in mRNA processing and transport